MIEVLFSIFYLSGLIKSFLINYEVNLFIDLTLLTSMLLIFSIVKKICTKSISLGISKNNFQTLYILIALFIWMVFTILYTPSEKYSYEKTLLFLTNILAFTIPLILTNFNIKKVLKIIVVAVPIMTIIYLNLMYQYQTVMDLKDAYRQISKLYLTCGVLLGINILILYTSKEALFKRKVISSLLLILSIILLLLLGARGPIFFTFISIFLFEAYRLFYSLLDGRLTLRIPKLTLVNIIYISISVVIFSFVIITFQKEISVLLERSLVRLNLILEPSPSGNMGSSVSIRVEQIGLSLNLIFSDFMSFIFGYGIGSYGILESGIDGRAYPHNIFLEICVELGVIGLFIFLFFLFRVVSKKNTNIYINSLLLIYILLNSLKSNSIVDIRIYFALIAMYLLSSNQSCSLTDSKKSIDEKN